LWDLLMYFYEEGYLLSFSSDNEERWRTVKEINKSDLSQD